MPEQNTVNKWYKDKQKFRQEIVGYEKKLNIREKVLNRYPNLETNLLKWREEERIKRTDRLRAKRARLQQELPFIPERQKELDKKARRARREEKRAKFEQENKELAKQLKSIIQRKKYDDLSDTDTDPDDEHLSKWSELEELPSIGAGFKKISKSKTKNEINLIEQERKQENERRKAQGLPLQIFQEDLRYEWRYKTQEEKKKQEITFQKLKDNVWYAACQGWYKIFKKVIRTQYDVETNSFKFFEYPHDCVLSEDFIEEPFMTPEQVKKEKIEGKINNYKFYYLPFFCVDLCDTWQEEYEVSNIEQEKKQDELKISQYKQNRDEEYLIFLQNCTKKISE